MAYPRVALVTNVLSSYRVPCFEALAARLPGQLDLFLLTRQMPHRNYVLAEHPTRLPVQLLPGQAWSHAPFDDLHLNDPRPVLRNHDLLILAGWAEPTFLLLWVLALLRRKRFAFWVESTLNEPAHNWWKETCKRLMLRRAAGAIVPGRNAAAYCEWLGMPRDRIFTAPNAVDVAYFRQQADKLLPLRDSIRRELAFDGVVLLFVGRMVEYFKRISILIQAYSRLETKGLPIQLVLVGEGDDRAHYAEMAASLGIKHIQFLDFMDHDALCRYYAAADLLVLPSRSETWGLVLNEGMEFGLPIVTAWTVGATPDLVIEGENGLSVPPEDVDALVQALERLVRNESLRREMGRASRVHIQDFTPVHWADGFFKAIEVMTGIADA